MYRERFERYKAKIELEQSPIYLAHQAIDKVMFAYDEKKDGKQEFELMRGIYLKHFAGKRTAKSFARFLGWGLSSLGLQLRKNKERNNARQENEEV